MHLGMAVVLVACLLAGVNELGAQEQSVSRTLSVQQAAIKDVVPPSAGSAAKAVPLEVLAWVDRPDLTYARGERVRLFVETNKDAYVTVLNVDPAGETTVLFPNRYESDNRIRGARAVEVPTPDSGAQVVVGGTVGAELLKIIASTKPVDLFEAEQLAEVGAFQQVRSEPQRVARSLVVAMNRAQPGVGSGEPRRSRPVGNAVAPEPASGTEWAMCHQTIATIPVPTATQQRTRSLQVLRTQNDGETVKCDEAAR